jgi:hypothetical protein
MFSFIRRLVEITWKITVDDDSPGSPRRRRGERPKIPKKCDNCQRILAVPRTWKYNNSLLCEKCYLKTVERFGEGEK